MEEEMTEEQITRIIWEIRACGITILFFQMLIFFLILKALMK